MSISVGATIPEGTFTVMGTNGPEAVSARELFAGKTAIVFGVPGAFTPTCSRQHLPGYVAGAEAIKARGVDFIACLATNDVHVMHAWSDATGAGGKVMMLADGNGTYTKALGMELDLSVAGMGMRTRRFSMIVRDGVVQAVNVEPERGVTVSGADAASCQL